MSDPDSIIDQIRSMALVRDMEALRRIREEAERAIQTAELASELISGTHCPADWPKQPKGTK